LGGGWEEESFLAMVEVEDWRTGKKEKGRKMIAEKFGILLQFYKNLGWP
jgi:hypothetical protein